MLALPLTPCQRKESAVWRLPKLGLHTNRWLYSHQWIPESQFAFPLFKLTLSFDSHSILGQRFLEVTDVPWRVRPRHFTECYQC